MKAEKSTERTETGDRINQKSLKLPQFTKHQSEENLGMIVHNCNHSTQEAEEGHKSKPSLSYIVSCRPAWAIGLNPVSQTNTKHIC